MALDIAPDPTIIEPSAPVETPTPESDSLADHEAQFSRGSVQMPALETDEERQAREDRDDKGRFKHRAVSQRATADDVGQINALTRELREKEAAWAKAHPDAEADSPRIRALKRQIKALDADLTPPKKTEPPAPVARQVESAPDVPLTGFTEPRPSLDDIGTKFKNWEEYEDAKDSWLARRAAWQSEQKQQAQSQAQYRAAVEELASTHNSRLAAFARTKPDFQTVTARVMTTTLPPILINAIAMDDNGPAYVYYLGQHPEALDEFVFDTDGKPLTEAHVATVQRRLKQHAQAVTTGSAAVARPLLPPRPPNPVRTGPIRTGDDLPSDESSLAEHERAFGPKRRR